MNDLVKRNEQQISPWAAHANRVQPSAIEGDLLKYKKGCWCRGEFNKDVPLGTRFVARMDLVWTGWVRWFAGKPVEYRGGFLQDFPPTLDRKDLGHNDESLWESDQQGHPKNPWAPTDLMGLRDEDGETLTFSTSSWGGRKAIGRLCREYDHLCNRPDHVGKYPVVEIGSRNRQSADFGPIPEPTFGIVSWIKRDENAMPDAEEPEGLKAPDMATELNEEIPF
jgi:hypothetical protein